MVQKASKTATSADLEKVPPHLVAEIIFGTLETHPRPAPRHATASLSLGAELLEPFQKGKGGPGGWIFMAEPELRLGPHVVVPDLAAWRRERLSSMPQTAYLELAPDWACEILSPSTERLDRGAKRRIYATYGVGHLWHLDPVAKLLEVFDLKNGQWVLFESFGDGETVKAPPFDAVSFPIAALWPLDPPAEPA